MDAETLSRVQFALTASFHFIFPPLSMGLGFMLLVVSGVYLRTKDPKWRQLAFFWTKVYGLIFALGVATGVVQEFEFGMNWADYSRFVGNVFGSLLAAEGVFAFFLEGGFLGLMLFGGNRLGPKLWFFATFMVVFGAHFSALWIIMANSWMQTPQGYEIVSDPAPARAVMTDFWQVVFTPSFLPRLLHVFVASWTAGSALMLSVSAWYLLKKRHVELARANFKLALPFFIVFAISNVVRLRRQAGHRGHERPAAQARVDGRPVAGHDVRAAVPRRLGQRGDADDERHLDPVPAQRARVLQPAGLPSPGLERFPGRADAADQPPVPGLPPDVRPGIAVRARRGAGRPALLLGGQEADRIVHAGSGTRAGSCGCS